jgi:endoglucanase
MFNRNVIGCIFLAAFLVVGGCSQKTGVSYTPANSTDENWVNGVARAWATAFIVTDSIQAKSDFAVGKKVTFSDGTVRTIVRQKENAGSLIVFLDGAPLDGKVVGYPNKIKVTDAAK